MPVCGGSVGRTGIAARGFADFAVWLRYRRMIAFEKSSMQAVICVPGHHVEC